MKKAFLEFFSKPKRPEIFHESAEIVILEEIASGTDFIREGTGETIVQGNIGQDVILTIRDSARVQISGNIGPGCRILKEGNGTLEIQGSVTDNLKLTVYGSGSVIFTQRPPEFVIRTIKDMGGTARIVIAGEQLPQENNQGYVHHNLGRSVPVPDPVIEPTPRPRPVIPQEPPAPPAEPSASEEFNTFTQEYIKTYRKGLEAKRIKTVFKQITELNLTREEMPMFAEFCDPITLEYIEDVLVELYNRAYNLSTVMELYEAGQPESCSRLPFKLNDVKDGRSLLKDLATKIAMLHQQRQMAAKDAEDETVKRFSM